MNNRGLLDFFIIRIPRITIPEKLALCIRFTDESEVLTLQKTDLEYILGRSLEKLVWDPDAWYGQAQHDAKTVLVRGMSTVSYTSDLYPPLLREIYDPPPLLFYWGRLPDPERSVVAMVGTRNPSSQGTALALKIAKEFAVAGVSVISGLAFGIDAMVHRGNLTGHTIAVLGAGLDEISPVSNRPLARHILEYDGCLLTEYPPGTTPEKWHFPQRNRLISGISRGTLIVEAPARSGALITGRYALEQGRDLWVAGVHNSPLGEGARSFSDEGAPIISSASDILAEWGDGI
jgi:DNA processing protein